MGDLYVEYSDSAKLLGTYPFSGNSFYTLIMAAMRQADTDNLEALQSAFPRVWNELRRRYNAPGGKLPGEVI